jgi:hypothetical protein
MLVRVLAEASRHNEMLPARELLTRTYCDDGFPLSIQTELDSDIDNVIPKIVCTRNVVQGLPYFGDVGPFLHKF